MKLTFSLIAAAALVTTGCNKQDASQSAQGPTYGAEKNDPAGAQPATSDKSDAEATVAARAALLPFLSNQRSNDVQVTVQNGTAKVTGRIGNANLQQDITRTLRQLPGIHGVENTVVVDPNSNLTQERIKNPDLPQTPSGAK